MTADQSLTLTDTPTGAQLDRAAGVLLATACGDALGAGYEFGPSIPATTPVAMVGGGGFGWAPGEWTDDTSMAIAIAEVAADGTDLRTADALDALAVRWSGWAREASDVGIQTRSVLSAAGSAPTGATLTAAATAHHARTGRSGGNGSLMRTAPVALAYLHDPGALVEAAHAVSALTHHDVEAGEACALWCLAIRHAVLHGTFDGLRLALDTLTPDRAAVWAARLDEAEANPPEFFDRNGWVVQDLQGAWSAIYRTPIPAEQPGSAVFAAQHLQLALEAAVRGGGDTDTVAAIAGGLLGARWGASAVPSRWRRIVHGWPTLRGRDLTRLAMLVARAGHSDSTGWPAGDAFDYTGYGDVDVLAVHPHDDGVLLGAVGALHPTADRVDAVVSLCRLGAREVPAWDIEPENHVEVWLIDSPDPAANPNLDFVLHDAARAVAELRAEGRAVLLHCVQAQSRTPAVGILYSVLARGVPLDRATRDVVAALPDAHPNRAFRGALQRLAGRAPGGRSRRDLVQDGTHGATTDVVEGGTRMSFQAYLDAIEDKTGLTPREFIALAHERGFGEPATKAGPIIAWLAADYGLGRGHAMALVHVIRNGSTIDSTHVGSLGSHRDESDQLWLDGKKNRP